MKYLRQFSIIALISLIGECLNHMIPLPIPASIYGIVILFTLLVSGVIKVSQIKEVSSFLIEIMTVIFLVPAVGLMESFSLLRPYLSAYVVIIVVSTAAVMIVSGLVTQSVMRSTEKKEEK